MLTERVNQLSVKNDNDLDFLLDENHNLTEMDSNTAESHTQDKTNRQNEECCSYTSSTRESWGRCSSLGAASDRSSSGERPGISNNKHKSMTLRALATPLRRIRRKPLTIPKERKNRSLWKRLNQERHDMGESLTQRFRLCIQGQAKHKRTKSSWQLWILILTQTKLLRTTTVHRQKWTFDSDSAPILLYTYYWIWQARYVLRSCLLCSS